MAADIDGLLTKFAESGASDLHLASGSKALARLHGELSEIDQEVLEHNSLLKLLHGIMDEHQKADFDETSDIDFAYEIEDVARFRVNMFIKREGVCAVFRIIPTKILTAEQLGLPMGILRILDVQRGLVVVTGPTGSGKSTTMAAMIDYLNKTRKDHILTIEDPVEFVHKSHSCLISHREVGRHTNSFASALKAALREDPDVILVGEMRDLETIQLAISAAETGHLVFGTLHTASAAKTVDRMIDVFPTAQQMQIRAMLSESLRAVIAQRLFKKKDGSGRLAAFEIMLNTPAIANNIREGKSSQIPSLIQMNGDKGMILMERSIEDAVNKGLIDPVTL